MTENAARHVKNYLDNRGHGKGMRLGVKTTGCSGMAYVLEVYDELQPEDIVFEDHESILRLIPRVCSILMAQNLTILAKG